MLDDLIHHVARLVHGDGKADSLIALGSVSDDGGVDADQFAAIVDQRTTGIARVDGGVGLDEVFVVFDAEVRAAGGADDAHGDALADAERIADGQGVVADLDFRGVADGDGGQIAGVDLHDRKIALGVGSDDFGFVLALIG